MRYDNGRTTLGSATIPAGSTSGTGSITLPGDDGASSGMLYGVPDFAKLELVGIQLADLEKGNTYTLTSNKTSFAIIDSTLGAAGGLNVLFDWEGAPSSDLDMYIYSADTFELYESAETGSRYEVDLFQNLNRPDGDYFIAVGVYSIGTDEPTRDLDYLFALTLPDGTVDIYTGTFEAAADGDFYFPVINQDYLIVLNTFFIILIFLISIYYIYKFNFSENYLTFLTGCLIFYPACFVDSPVHIVLMGVTMHYTQYLYLTSHVHKSRTETIEQSEQYKRKGIYSPFIKFTPTDFS